VGVVWRFASSSSFSFLVSERWMISGAWYLLASARQAFSVSSELVYSACGATAAVIKGSF